jgi:ATP-dependent RNA helicase DDX24/MAK5
MKWVNIKLAMFLCGKRVKPLFAPTGTAGTLTEARILCTLEEKDLYLYYFIQQHPGRTLIFCNSISCVRRLAQLLTLLRCHPLPLHANMMQRQRLKNLDRFRDSPCGLLLATDVAARGLDIPGVQHVIHYQVPRTSEVSYRLRSGTTMQIAVICGTITSFLEPQK